MEAAELASYLFVTCVVMTLFQHPASPIHKIIPAGIWRRMLAGLVMGITAIGIPGRDRRCGPRHIFASRCAR
jgi:hypothetical protein